VGASSYEDANTTIGPIGRGVGGCQVLVNDVAVKERKERAEREEMELFARRC